MLTISNSVTHTMMKFIALLFSTLLITSCGSESTPATKSAATKSAIQADLLVSNATIWTAESNSPEASVLATKDGDIIYVGNGDDVDIDAAETIDLNGRFLMPGFIDNHVHFLEGGFGLASVMLRDANTREEFSKRIGDYANTRTPGQWVLNGNWDHTLWGGELPQRGWIDELTGDTPVAVMRLDGHMMLANSAALRLAGIDASTETPAGGEIVRGSDGAPTGILKDSAMFIVHKVIPAPSGSELLVGMKLAQDHALSLGLTQVHAMVAGETEANMIDAFLLARDKGMLKLRAKVFSPIQSWQVTRDYVKENGAGDELLNWNGAKGLTDGALGSATAWFHEPFSDDPNNSGFAVIDPKQLNGLVVDADKAGLKTAIHAIGDKAIDKVIDIFEAIGGSQTAERRFRIEHFQHPSQDAITRIGKLGIIAAAHPYHAIDDGRWAEEKVGPERIKTTYAFRSILNAGGILSFGSDWPVAPLAPLEGVYAAVTRRTIDGKTPDGWQPQEKISVEEALRAYTITNAYLGFEETRSGSLKAGKRADFVVLSDDPRTIAPEDIRALTVRTTVINGEVVYGTL